jgi:hypothetical protein
MGRDTWNVWDSLDTAFESGRTRTEITNRRTTNTISFPFTVAERSADWFCAALDINLIVLTASDVELSSSGSAGTGVKTDARGTVYSTRAIECSGNSRSTEGEQTEEGSIHCASLVGYSDWVV